MAMTKPTSDQINFQNSVALPQSLTVDGTTLVVNGSTNRVGIGVAVPTTALDVSGTVTATALAAGAASLGATTATSLSVNGNIDGSTIGALASSLLPTGTVLQVVFRSTTETTNHGNVAYTNTGVYATIVPKRTTSKIIMLASVNSYLSGADMRHAMRFAKEISGVYTPVADSEHNYVSYSNNYLSLVNVFIAAQDSPATTSPLSYVVQCKWINSGGAATTSQINVSSSPAGRSSMILVEVAV